MKKYLNRALLYKDIKFAKWLGVLLFGEILLFKTFLLISQVRDAKALIAKGIPYDDMFQSFKWSLASSKNTSMAYLLITIALIAVVLMWHERSNTSYALTASMPFRREEIMACKLFIGNTIVLLAFLMNFVLMSIIYVSNSAIMADSFNYIDLPKWFLINSITYMAVFTVLMFVQSVMGNSLLAGISGIILVSIPEALLSAIASVLSLNEIHIIPQYLRNIGKSLFLLSYNDGSLAKIGGSTYNLYYYNYTLKITVILIIIIAFSLLSILLYKKNNLERSSSFVMFKPLSTVFRMGFSICFGILFAFTFNAVAEILVWKLLFFDILLAVGIAIGYFISSKIVKSTSKAVTR